MTNIENEVIDDEALPIGPPTGDIEGEDPIVYSESSDSEESDEETRPKLKTDKKVVFDKGFNFDDNDDDPWRKVFLKRKGKKRKVEVKVKEEEIDEDIQVIQAKKAKIKEEVLSSEEESDGEDEDDINSEDNEIQDLVFTDTADKINVRDEDIKLKEKQNKLKKKKQRKQQELEDEKDREFFEAAKEAKADITFQEMNLSRPLMKAIDNMGYENPTPIQASTIPVALLGRDICGCAATGTGKTAAFMLPIIERLIFKPAEDNITRVLVIVPTRELGVQVYEVTKGLAKFSLVNVALSVGGLDLRTQESNLRRNPDIVIATPGRLIDHLKNTPSFSLDRIEILVLDEADRMLDEFFAEQMTDIIKQCSKSRQTMLFSATMTTEVKDLAAVSLKNPIKVFVNNNTNVAQNLRQEFVKIKRNEEFIREAILVYLLTRTFHEHCIVFVQTKVNCHRLAILLSLLNVSVGELHGNLNQIKRLEALDKFKNGDIGVLFCTDLAARGLDIAHVKTVINFTLPSSYQHYVHRVGRTARAGHCGRSISLCGDSEYKLLKQIKKASNTVVYERVPNRNILLKFKAKIEKLEKKIECKLKKEKEEKDLIGIESKIERIKRKLQRGNSTQHERLWYQTTKERREAKKRQMADKKQMQKNELSGRKEKKEKKLTPQELRIQKELDMAVRAGKRDGKVKKLYAYADDVEPAQNVSAPVQNQKKKNKSLFAQDLTKTDFRTVKKLRNSSSSNFKNKPNFKTKSKNDASNFKNSKKFQHGKKK